MCYLKFHPNYSVCLNKQMVEYFYVHTVLNGKHTAYNFFAVKGIVIQFLVWSHHDVQSI